MTLRLLRLRARAGAVPSYERRRPKTPLYFDRGDRVYDARTGMCVFDPSQDRP